MPVIDVPPDSKPLDNTLLGKGLYSQKEAAEIIGLRLPGIKRQTLSNWAYGKSGNDSPNDAVFETELLCPPRERIITFLDLIELHFIAMFRHAGVPLRVIRAGAKRAAFLFDARHPFAMKRFRTDGKRIFAELESDPAASINMSKVELIQDLQKAQMVIGAIAEPFFRSVDYDYEALKYWPLGRDRGVILDPNRQFGKPIVASAGVPTRIIYQMSLSGESLENIADWYDVSIDEVIAAIELETRWDAVSFRQ